MALATGSWSECKRADGALPLTGKRDSYLLNAPYFHFAVSKREPRTLTLSPPTPNAPTREPGNPTDGLAEPASLRAAAVQPIVLSSRARERLRVLNQVLESVGPSGTRTDNRPAEANVTVSND